MAANRHGNQNFEMEAMDRAPNRVLHENRYVETEHFAGAPADQNFEMQAMDRAPNPMMHQNRYVETEHFTGAPADREQNSNLYANRHVTTNHGTPDSALLGNQHAAAGNPALFGNRRVEKLQFNMIPRDRASEPALHLSPHGEAVRYASPVSHAPLSHHRAVSLPVYGNRHVETLSPSERFPNAVRYANQRIERTHSARAVHNLVPNPAFYRNRPVENSQFQSATHDRMANIALFENRHNDRATHIPLYGNRHIDGAHLNVGPNGHSPKPVLHESQHVEAMHSQMAQYSRAPNPAFFENRHAENIRLQMGPTDRGPNDILYEHRRVHSPRAPGDQFPNPGLRDNRLVDNAHLQMAANNQMRNAGWYENRAVEIGHSNIAARFEHQNVDMMHTQMPQTGFFASRHVESPRLQMSPADRSPNAVLYPSRPVEKQQPITPADPKARAIMRINKSHRMTWLHARILKLQRRLVLARRKPWKFAAKLQDPPPRTPDIPPPPPTPTPTVPDTPTTVGEDDGDEYSDGDGDGDGDGDEYGGSSDQESETSWVAPAQPVLDRVVKGLYTPEEEQLKLHDENQYI